MLWLALLGEEVVVLHQFPQKDDDIHACPEELAEAAVLHLRRPDDPRRPVLDVPGGMKKYVAEVCVVWVVVIVVIVVVARDGEVTAHLIILRRHVDVGIDVVDGGGRGGGRGGSSGGEKCHFWGVWVVWCVLCVVCCGFVVCALVCGGSEQFVTTVVTTYHV